MTGINHGLTGAVIALTVKQPALAIPLAFVSHFIQDTVPHWNYGVTRAAGRDPKFFSRRFNLMLLADFFLSVSLMVILAILFPSKKWLIWACMIAAASPDLMWAYYRLFIEHIKNEKARYDPLARLHILVQWSQTPVGFLVEAAWFILAGLIILRLK